MSTDTVTTNEPASGDRANATPCISAKRRISRRRILLTALLLLLLVPVLVFTGHQISVTTTCAGLISSADYAQVVHPAWDAKMMVQEADALDGGEPASLVQVSQSDHTLSVWVYGCTMRQGHPQLVQLFAEPGLRQGIVEIS